MEEENERKTVLIVKSDKLLNELLCEFVKSEGLTLIENVFKGADAIPVLKEKIPDLLIAGMEMEGQNGIDLTFKVQEDKLPTKTILFSRRKNFSIVKMAFYLKVNGFLFYDDGLDEFSKCIKTVLSGKSFMSTGVEQFLRTSRDELKREKSLKKDLTPTELKVLWYVSQHLSIKQIAERMYISPHTVNNHLSNIREKLGLRGRGSLLKYVLSKQK